MMPNQNKVDAEPDFGDVRADRPGLLVLCLSYEMQAGYRILTYLIMLDHRACRRVCIAMSWVKVCADNDIHPDVLRYTPYPTVKTRNIGILNILNACFSAVFSSGH